MLMIVLTTALLLMITTLLGLMITMILMMMMILNHDCISNNISNNANYNTRDFVIDIRCVYEQICSQMNTRQHFLVPLFIWNFVMMFPKPNESWHFKFIISSNSSIFGCLDEDASAIAFQMRIYIIVCSNSVIDIVLCAAMNDTNYNVCI